MQELHAYSKIECKPAKGVWLSWYATGGSSCALMTNSKRDAIRFQIVQICYRFHGKSLKIWWSQREVCMPPAFLVPCFLYIIVNTYFEWLHVWMLLFVVIFHFMTEANSVHCCVCPLPHEDFCLHQEVWKQKRHICKSNRVVCETTLCAR